MKTHRVILTRCYIGTNVTLWPLNRRQKDQSLVRSLLAGAAACTEASEYQNFHLNSGITMHQCGHRI